VRTNGDAAQDFMHVKERVTVKYVVTRGMQRDADRVQQEMEEMFRSMLPGRPAVDPNRKGLWRPAIEVYETTQSLVVNVEIAGIVQDDLRISLDGDRLSIRGVRHDRHQAEKRSYHEARIPYGAFGADVFVPFPIDADAIEAEYAEGFLRIALPKLKARTIVPRPIASATAEGAFE
jgi:HSP20 family molecular chaperone IbpA